MAELQQGEVAVTIIPRRVIFQSINEEDDSSFTVLACDVKEKGVVPVNKYGNITITGDNLSDLILDIETPAYLAPSDNSRYSDGFTARIPVPDIPDDSVGQWKFLRVLIPANLYANFMTTYDSDIKIIDFILDESNADEIIEKTKGIGQATLDIVIKKINEKSELAKTYTLLADYGMTDTVIKKIYNKYEVYKVIKKIVETDIFRLTEIKGLGFKKIDEIYLKQEGSDKKDDNRIVSGLEYYILENQENGNTRIPQRKLIQGTQTLLGISVKLIREVLEERTLEIDRKNIYNILNDSANYPEKYSKKIVLFEDRYSAVKTFLAEWFVYTDLVTRASNESQLKLADMDVIIKEFGDKSGFHLSDEQSQFFRNLHKSELSFLLGSSGTGKSSAQSVLLDYARKTGQSVLFLAPTGMARKRITEVTGNVAYTIHSFALNKQLQSTYYDIYLVDEASMVDVMLAKRLLSLIPHGKKVVFVGDGSQIPSVSFGNFLYDCTNNKTISVDSFTKVFRQSEGGILDIVTKIRQGEQFLPSTFNSRKKFGSNCVFDMRQNPNETYVDKIMTAYKNTIATGKFNEDDIIILSPTKKGKNGTVSINKAVQSFINKPERSKDEFDSKTDGIDVIFRVGDKVLNRKNRKKLKTFKQDGRNFMPVDNDGSVVNGDIGRLVGIEHNYVYVDFDGIVIEFKKSDFNNNSIIHGWAITGHKSQGSEFKVVFCLFERGSAFQLNGNLVYTMGSRAKELLLVMGDMRTINGALKKFENTSRDTNLLDFFAKKLEFKPKAQEEQIVNNDFINFASSEEIEESLPF